MNHAKFGASVLGAFLVVCSNAGASVVSIESTGFSREVVFGQTFRGMNQGFNGELMGRTDSYDYGHYSARIMKSYYPFNYAKDDFSGHPGVYYENANYAYGYAVGFQDAAAQENWQSKIDNRSFADQLPNILVSDNPFAGALFNYDSDPVSIQTLPDSSLGSIHPLVAQNTHYYQVTLSATLAGDTDLEQMEFLDQNLRNMVFDDGLYANRDAGLPVAAETGMIQAYADSSLITGYDVRIALDQLGDLAAPNVLFSATYTFWHSEAATTQVTADLDAEITSYLEVYRLGIGFFSGLQNQQYTVSRGVAAVPEPSTVMLLGSLGGLALRRRR